MVNQDFNESCIIVPAISIHTDELYIYGRREWIKEPDYHNRKSLVNLLNNKRKIEISNKSKQKIKRATKYLLYNSTIKTAYNYKTNSRFTFKVNFITLTLASEQKHTDQEIKKELLNQFLIEAKRKWHIVNYVWRAEKQTNGNIHFHILCDKFIPWLELRNTWNRIQNKLGYVDSFFTKYNHRNPNSTDVHSLKKVENVAAYVTKYITKVDNGKSVDGENWRCSKELSNLKGGRADLNNTISNEIERLQELPKVKRIDKDHFSGIFFDNHYITIEKFPVLYKLLNEYIVSIFGSHQIEIYNNS
jgi:uncharacterized ubiquitin-like protein YukD